MKYISLGLSPTTRAIHPVDHRIATLGAVTRQSIPHIDFRGHGLTVLYRLTGDREVLAAALADDEDVADFELVDDEEGFSAYIRATASESGGELLTLANEHALIVETPVEVTPDGPEVTLVGTHDALRRALESTPDHVTTTVLSAGPYTPTASSLLGDLTERQQEVFRTAVEQGYYELPRGATHEDLANELDCSPSTVDQHLRKAESRVVAGLLG